MAHPDYSKNSRAHEILEQHMHLADESIQARAIVCEAKTSKLHNAEHYYHKVRSQMQAAMPNWKSSHNSLSSFNPASNHSTGDSSTSSYSYLSGAGMPTMNDFNLQQLADEVASARTRVEMLRIERNQERKWLDAANIGVSRLRIATEQGLKPPVSGVFSGQGSTQELHQLSGRIIKLKEKLSLGEHERRHYLQELAVLLQKQSQLTYQPQVMPKTTSSVQTDLNIPMEGALPVSNIPAATSAGNVNNFGQLALLKLQYRDLCAQIEQMQHTMVLFECKHPPREWTGQLSTDRVQLVMQLKEHLLKDYTPHENQDLLLRLNHLEADIKREWELEWQRAALREQLFQALRHRNILSQQIQSLSNTTLSSFSSESSLTSSLGSLNSLPGADVVYRMPPPYLVSNYNQNGDPRFTTMQTAMPPNIIGKCETNPGSTGGGEQSLQIRADSQTDNRLSNASSHHYCNLPVPSSKHHIAQSPIELQQQQQQQQQQQLPAQPLEAELPESEPPNYEAHLNNVLRRAANRYYVNVSGDEAIPGGSASYLPCQEECRSVSAAVSNESVAGDSGVFEAKLESSLYLQLYLQLSYDYHSQIVYLHIHSLRNLSTIAHLLNSNPPPPSAASLIPTNQNEEISLKLDLSPRMSHINASSSWMSLSHLLESSNPLSGITYINQRFTFPLAEAALSHCALQVFLSIRAPEQVIGCCKISLADLPSSGSSNAYYWFPMRIWSTNPPPPTPESHESPLDWLPQREINDDYVNLASCNYLNALRDCPGVENLRHLLHQTGYEESCAPLSSSTPIYAYNNNSSSSEETPVCGMTASASTFICIEDEEVAAGAAVSTDATTSSISDSTSPKHLVSASQPTTLTRAMNEESLDDSNADDDSSQSDIDIPRRKRHKSATKLKSEEISNLNEIHSKAATGSNLTAFLRHLAQRRGTIDQETSTLPVSSLVEPACHSGMRKTVGAMASPERFIKRSQTYTGEKASTFSRESSTRTKILRKRGGSDAKGKRNANQQQCDKTTAITSGYNSPSALNRSESDSQLITASTLRELSGGGTFPMNDDSSNRAKQSESSNKEAALLPNSTLANYMDSASMANLNLNLDLQALEQRLAEQAKELSNLNRLTIALQEKLESCRTAEQRVAILEDLESREPRLCQIIMQQLQLQSHLAESETALHPNHRSKEERKVNKLLRQVDIEARQLRREFNSEGRPMKISLNEKLAYFTRGMKAANNFSFDSHATATGSTAHPSSSNQPLSNLVLNNDASTDHHTSSEV